MLALSLTPEPSAAMPSASAPYRTCTYLVVAGDTIRCLLYGQALVHTIQSPTSIAPPLQNSRRLEPGLPKSHGDTILVASPHSPPAPPLHH